MSPALLVMAAGMGSRYGGLKQIDRFGPSGETIMDYAVHDALAAGFTKVVFVVRRYFEADFRAAIGGKYEKRIAVDYVFQEMDELPPGAAAVPERKKPWGTAHAVWCARGCAPAPFACINADDYYGKRAFALAARHLRQASAAAPGALPEYCIVGYPVLPTLSEHGGVARAICEVDAEGFLTGLVERLGMERWGDKGRHPDGAGGWRVLAGDEVVSMNLMGFSPSIFAQLERHLSAFFATQKVAPDNSECLLPTVVGRLVAERAARVRVLPTTDAWFGVTHPQDKPAAIARIRAMVERGDYPTPLWNEA